MLLEIICSIATIITVPSAVNIEALEEILRKGEKLRDGAKQARPT